MNTISQRLEQAYPEDDKGWGASIKSMRDETVGDVRPALLMMLGAVAFVLLIACANVANLILARTFARRKEIAIRTAMGATRARIVQQLLGESLIISLCGGALGLIAAHYGIQLLIKFFADKLPRIGDIGLHGPVLAFTFALSIATGLLSGLLPAWSMTKGDVNEALKQGLGRTDADSGTGKTRSALVVIEVALSLVLLIGAGLMLRSLWNLQTIDPGFDEHNVLTLTVMVNKHQFTDPTQESQFFDISPPAHPLPARRRLRRRGRQSPAPGRLQPARRHRRPSRRRHVRATRGLRPRHHPRIPSRHAHPPARGPRPQRLRHRQLNARRRHQPIHGQTVLAEQKAPSATISSSPSIPDKDREIVGVVGDVKQLGLDSSAGIATLYWPLAQISGSPLRPPGAPYPLSLAVRTTTPPQTLSIAVTDAIHQVNKDIPVDNVMTLEDFVGETLTQHSFNMQLLAIFGLLALVLCAIGIYSVLAYSVKRGMKEIGLRIAFGATLRDVARHVIVQGMKPTLAGIGIGLHCILRPRPHRHQHDLRSQLPRPRHLLRRNHCSSSSSRSAASLIPALRATRVDPLAVLREE